MRRTGGFAGLTREWTVHIEADEASWRELIEALPWDSVPDDPESVDRFTYHVACDGREARLPEAALTGPWRELVRRVQSADDVGGIP